LISIAWESEEVDGVVPVVGDVEELLRDPDVLVVDGALSLAGAGVDPPEPAALLDGAAEPV
jgi:hypothetical protein